MKIAAIQATASTDIPRGISRAIEMAEIAVEKEAKIICYPELFLTPWFPREEDSNAFAHSLELSSEPLHQFREFSEKTRTVLIVPFFESSQGKYYNSTAVFDSGKILGVYRKIHLPDIPHYREQYYFSPGTGFPVFETTYGRIGVQICWDNLFPEGSRILALKGAEVIIAPTAAALNTHSLWERAIAANAFANNVFVFRVNRVGQENGLSFYGRSFCVDPWGEMVSELTGSKEAIVLAELNLDERRLASETWGFLKNRRPGEYRELVQ